MRPSSQNVVWTTSSSSSKLSTHKGSSSHATTKLPAKPKIRVVHMLPPEVIKTSVHDFCEIVQRLTGKPTAGDGGRDLMYNMLQKDYNNGKGKSEHGFSGGAWMNEFSMQDLAQFPLEVEDIIDVFSKERAD